MDTIIVHMLTYYLCICVCYLQDDGSRIYAWIMYSNFGRQLLCKVITVQHVVLYENSKFLLQK